MLKLYIYFIIFLCYNNYTKRNLLYDYLLLFTVFYIKSEQDADRLLHKLKFTVFYFYPVYKIFLFFDGKIFLEM